MKLYVFYIFVGFGEILNAENTEKPIPGCEIYNNKIARYLHFTTKGYQYIEDASALYPMLPTYIIAHGWNSNVTTDEVYLGMARDLVVSEMCNVILVDYQDYAQKSYSCAQKIFKAVGEHLSDFLVTAISSNQLDPAKVHMIGHSLGAHILGLTGRIVQKSLKVTIRRISALDPAGLLFESDHQGLNAADAKVVDVVHCAALFGITAAVGTVDFYADGLFGLFQGPCVFRPYSFGCSHGICKEYYIETIKSCAIRGKKLNSDEMDVYGHHMNESITGIYKFVPNMLPPYGKYEKNCQ